MLCVDKQRRVFETFRAERYMEEFLCIYRISYSCKVVFFHATRYMLAYHVLHAERVKNSIRRNGEKAKRGRDDAVLPSVYPVHVLAS